MVVVDLNDLFTLSDGIIFPIYEELFLIVVSGTCLALSKNANFHSLKPSCSHNDDISLLFFKVYLYCVSWRTFMNVEEKISI